MRVLANTTPFVCGVELVWSRIVQQQERAQVLAKIGIGKQGANRKTIANPMSAFIAIEAENFFAW